MLGTQPTGRANARPMTGSAKQSIVPRNDRMDCFVALLLARTMETIQNEERPQDDGGFVAFP